MTTRIEQLREGGFSQVQVDQWVNTTRQQLSRGGFDEKAINAYIGMTKYDPKPMKDSMQTFLSKDEPDSFWDNFLKAFEPDWAQRRARSYKALVGATKANLSPSKFEPTMKDALSQGYQQSVTGLIQRGKLPDNTIPAAAMKYLPTRERIAMQTATVAGDMPFMVAGGVIGGVSGGPAAPLTAMGGAFALPAGLRKVYIDMYEKGQIKNFSEFWQRMGDSVMETLKGEAIGIATAAAGLAAPGVATYPAEVAAMTTLGAAMEGAVPQPQDFLDAAIVVGGLKGSTLISKRMGRIYSKTGEHPYAIAERTRSEPKLQEELLSSNFDKDIKRLPIIERDLKNIEPAKDGTTRLYRAESPTVKFEDVFDLKKLEKLGIERGKSGKSYTADLDYADYFRATYGKDAKINYIDIPTKDLQKYAVASKSGTFQNEFIIPREEVRVKGFVKGLLQNERGEVKIDLIKPETAQSRILEKISTGSGKDKKPLFDRFHDFYTAMVDESHPLGRVVKQMAEGEKLAAEKDPYVLARLFRGQKGIADHFLEYSPFDFKSKTNYGKSFREVVTPVKNDLNGLRAYMASRRAIELESQGRKSGFDLKDATEVVEKGGKYEKVFDELVQYQDSVLKYYLDSGIISKKVYNRFKEMGKDYVPFYRVVDKKPKGTGKGLEAFDAIKALKGSDLTTIDPLESIVKNTYLFTNLAERNRIGESLVSLAKQKDGIGQYVKKLKKPIKPIRVTKEEAGTLEDFTIFRPNAFFPKENQIRVWNKGKAELYEVHPDIARVFKSLDAESTNILLKIASFPAKLLRAGAVLSPEFIARNPFRDQLSAFVYSKWGFSPGVDLVKGVASLLRKDEFYRDWQKSGGMLSEITALDRTHLQNNVGQTLAKYPVLNRIRYGTKPIEMMRVLSELSEQATRVGAFKKARKKGASLAEAGFEAREVTLDFARIGAKTRAMNSITAFFNANVQGLDKTVRTFKDNPVQATMKVAAGITLPSVLLAIANHDDGRWDDIPRWQKDLFWIVMPGHVSKERWSKMTAVEQSEFTKDNHIWRVPKPFELGILFGTVPERFVEAALEKDPGALTGIWEAIKRGGTPGVIPTLSVPVIENWANKSLFLDRPLIPASKEAILPEYQYKNYTSEAAKAIGKLLGKLPAISENPNIAPVKIENLIRGWSGGLGMHILRLASLGLEKTGVLPTPERPTSTFSDWPVIKAFHVRYPASGSENVNTFYNNYFKAKKRIDTFKHLVKKEFNPKEALKVISAGQEKLVKLDGIYKGISNAHQALNLIHNNSSLNPDEKRQLIDRVYLDMSKMAKFGNDLTKEIRKMIKEETQ